MALVNDENLTQVLNSINTRLSNVTASTATKLATARSFTMSGDVTSNSPTFDGTGNVALTTTLAEKDMFIRALTSAVMQTAPSDGRRGTTQCTRAELDLLKRTGTFGISGSLHDTIGGISFSYSVGIHIEMGTVNNNYAYQLLFDYDGGGIAYRVRTSQSTPTWTAWKLIYDNSLTVANATYATTAGSTSSATTASTATTLATARTIGISGGATGTATSFNGSANITIPVTAVNASYVTGTLPVTCLATNSTDYTTSRVRNIYAGTAAMSAGSTALTSGSIYLQYE